MTSSEPGDSAPAGARALPPERDILQHLLRTTLDVGMVALDLRGRILDWNAGAEHLFGYTLEEVRFSPLQMLSPRGHPHGASADAFVDEATRSGRAEEERSHVRKDGSHFWGRDTLTLVHAHSGECLGLGLVVQDLTRHREFHDVLRKTSRRFRPLQEPSREGHAMLGSVRDAAGEIVDFEFLYADPAGKKAFDAPGRTLSGARLREQKPEALAEQLFSGYVKVVETGQTLEKELYFEHLDGADWFRVKAVKIGDGIALSLANLTRVRRADRALQNNEARYLQAQKLESLGRLTGGVAHDFNNMLTAIMINAHLLLQNLPDEDPRRVYTEEIDGIAAHASALTQQLLAYGGKHEPRERAVDLNRVIRAVVTMLRRLIGEDVKLRTDLDPALPPIMADPVHIQQVLLNLVINARDALPGGGRITIETRSRTVAGEDRAGGKEIDQEEAGQGATGRGTPVQGGEGVDDEVGLRPVMLSVSDTGIGIDEKIRKHIFEPFFTTRKGGKGTGLGLATVQTIVRKSNGIVRVESEVGKGSTFRILFPRAPEGVAGGVEAEGDSDGAHGTETILFVEDDPMLRDAARAYLRSRGYRVIEAKSGEGALWRAQQQPGPIDLVVADVRMPGMSGIDLVRKLRDSRPGLRALFISGYAREEALPEGPSAGDAFLWKPFSPDVLARAIRRVLDGAGRLSGAQETSAPRRPTPSRQPPKEVAQGDADRREESYP